jgi:hypothetical protein
MLFKRIGTKIFKKMSMTLPMNVYLLQYYLYLDNSTKLLAAVSSLDRNSNYEGEITALMLG